MSEGCTTVNEPLYDSAYGSASVGPLPFLAGEVLTLSVGEPIAFGTPTQAALRVNGMFRDGGGFPAVLSFTVPADDSYRLLWNVFDGGGTWTVSCAMNTTPTTTVPATTTAPETTTILPATTTTAVLPSTSMPTTTTTEAATTTAADTTTTADQTTTTAGKPTSTVMSPPNTGTLPRTGPSRSSNIAGAAIIVLLAGALALVVARSRAA